MARLNLKLLLFTLVVLMSCTLVLYMFQCSHSLSNYSTYHRLENLVTPEFNKKYYEELDCSINGLYHISCRKEGQEVFLPFTFLEKYYEVYGKLVKSKGNEHFEWSHSYSKIFRPTSHYNSSGMFMYFSN